MIDQLSIGKSVEREHAATLQYLIDNPNASIDDAIERIALDHLKEIPDYYDRLDRMEREAMNTNQEEDLPFLLRTDSRNTKRKKKQKTIPVYHEDSEEYETDVVRQVSNSSYFKSKS